MVFRCIAFKITFCSDGCSRYLVFMIQSNVINSIQSIFRRSICDPISIKHEIVKLFYTRTFIPTQHIPFAAPSKDSETTRDGWLAYDLYLSIA